jgi:hypothetical protein
MISAKVELNQPLKQQRQFVGQAGSGHHLLLDDAAGKMLESRCLLACRRSLRRARCYAIAVPVIDLSSGRRK